MNKVCVKGQRIYFYRRPEPIPKSQVNFSRIEFDMDEAWSSFLSVVAQFIQGGEPKNVQVKDGYCFVPPELEVGDFELCLRGDDGESVVASVNRLTFEVCEGFDPSGETPLPPSPDLYTQLIKEIDSGKKIAQSVREDADAGLFNGERGADGGWYTPSVTQTDENTLRMDFTPSKGDMPGVEHTDIMLPDGGGGTSDHSKLSNRDAADQHPMSAITGLEKALGDKQPVGEYLTTETDPTVPAWAKAETKPSYTASEVGADPSGTATARVSSHNTEATAHSDIRLLIQGLTDRLNSLADSDDTTLDQLSEIVAYIKSNRTLIEAITTSKVSVADIIDNLTTNVTNKPLSSAQGVALKAMIDAITIPTALPNPNALTFTGTVSGSYDGSAPLEVEIPSGGGGLTVTNTAAVGQTIKVSAVDETGQPTEWEAVDMASGGGGISGFRLVRDITLTEDAESVIINSDDSGNPFSLSECYIWVLAKVTEAGKILYIPNGYWVSETYLQSTSNTATDYDYIFAAYSVGSKEMFWGYEIITRGEAAQKNYNTARRANGSIYFDTIKSYRVNAKFAAGARFLLYGRDA